MWKSYSCVNRNCLYTREWKMIDISEIVVNVIFHYRLFQFKLYTLDARQVGLLADTMAAAHVRNASVTVQSFVNSQCSYLLNDRFTRDWSNTFGKRSREAILPQHDLQWEKGSSTFLMALMSWTVQRLSLKAIIDRSKRAISFTKVCFYYNDARRSFVCVLW